MNVQQLKYIVEIADCHSITKASQKLFVSQPYLSKVVSDFEAKINQQIFIRHPNGLELTPYGHKVYLLAQSILSQMERLENLEQEEREQNDRVKLSFSVGNLILKDSLLLDYVSIAHAAIHEINLDETTIEGCIRNIEEGISEFAIVVADDFQKTLLSQVSARKDITLMELDKGDPYYHFHRDYPLTNQEEIRIDSLMQYPFARLKMDEYARFSVEKWKKEYPDLYVRKILMVNQYHSYLNLVKHGYAFMVGNKWQISELEKIGIHSTRISSSPHQVHLLLLKKKFIPFSPEAKRFLHIFQDSYGLGGV